MQFRARAFIGRYHRPLAQAPFHEAQNAAQILRLSQSGRKSENTYTHNDAHKKLAISSLHHQSQIMSIFASQYRFGVLFYDLPCASEAKSKFAGFQRTLGTLSSKLLSSPFHFPYQILFKLSVPIIQQLCVSSNLRPFGVKRQLKGSHGDPGIPPTKNC